MRFTLCVLALAGMLFAACGDDGDSGGNGASPGASGPRAETPSGAGNGAADDGSHGNAPGIPALEGEVVATASGLRYIDEREGSGPQPSPTQCVTVHYTGWLTNGTQFDSSVSRGQPAVFSLNGVIAGWTEGVGSMKEGGKRRLIIPSELAYGPEGRQGIPPNSTLIFDVELIEVGGEPVVVGGRPTCA